MWGFNSMRCETEIQLSTLEDLLIGVEKNVTSLGKLYQKYNLCRYPSILPGRSKDENFYLSATGDETSSSIQPTNCSKNEYITSFKRCNLSEAVKACTVFSISIRLGAWLLSCMSLIHKLPDLLYQVPSPKLSIYT